MTGSASDEMDSEEEEDYDSGGTLKDFVEEGSNAESSEDADYSPNESRRRRRRKNRKSVPTEHRRRKAEGSDEDEEDDSPKPKEIKKFFL